MPKSAARPGRRDRRAGGGSGTRRRRGGARDALCTVPVHSADHGGLVDAAETRRILDRLYGYEVSPVLWRRVNRGLSAGRVQSPSIRLIVERERERIAFVAADYWDIDLLSATAPAFDAKLARGVAGRQRNPGQPLRVDARLGRIDRAGQSRRAAV